MHGEGHDAEQTVRTGFGVVRNSSELRLVRECFWASVKPDCERVRKASSRKPGPKGLTRAGEDGRFL